MRLSHKLSLAQIVLICGILVIYGAIQLRREVRQFRLDMRRDQNQTGQGLAAAAEDIWMKDGPASAIKLVRDADAAEAQVDIRWIPLDDRRIAGQVTWPPPDIVGALLRGETAVWTRAGGQGEDSLSTFVPLRVDGRVQAAVQVGEPLTEERVFARTTLLHLSAIAGAIGLGAALISGLLGASIIVRPMGELVDQARRVGSGDLSFRLRPQAHDEIGRLAGEMNQMCDRLSQAQTRLSQETRARISALEQLRHADRLATVGTLASGIAHELGTPLNVVSGRAKMIEVGSVGEIGAPETARIIREQAERMTGIIRQLLDFARRGEVERLVGDLRPMARQTLNLLQPMALKRCLVLSLAEEDGPPVRVRMDVGQIKQVLTNLVLNAIQAMSSGGRVTVRIESKETSPPAEYGGTCKEYACLQVEDEGCGIPSDSLPSIFDPFYTTKGVSEGTGLGLSVSYGIAREHGGWIEVESAVGVGSRFRVYLPIEEATCPARS